MRILHIGRFNNPLQNGGVERHQQQLCQGLAEENIDVTCLVANNALKTVVKKDNGYDLIEAASFGTAFSTAISLQQILVARQLHAQRPFDIVHVHFPNPIAQVAAQWLPRSVKRIVTWHSDIVKQKNLLKLYLPIMQRFVRNCDAIIAATDGHFQSSSQIPPDFSKENLHTIPYGLDFSHLNNENQPLPPFLSSILNAGSDKPIVFALGRHVYYKGFDVLIKAMQSIDAHLILGGEGPLSGQLQQQVAALNLSKRIHFTGRIQEADLAAYFQKCTIFCLPSNAQSEAFGLVQLEAMACGKAVVCTQLGNGVNVVNTHGVTGLAAKVNDAHDLARCINELLNNPPLRHRLGQQAKERAINEYSVHAMIDKHIKLYEKVLKT